jgi:hypothetical protein
MSFDKKELQEMWKGLQSTLPKTQDLITIFETPKRKKVYGWIIDRLYEDLAVLNTKRIEATRLSVTNKDGWAMETKITWIDERIKLCQSAIKRYEIKKELLRGKEVDGKKFKSIPIEEIRSVKIVDEMPYGVPERSDYDKDWYKCPLHTEDSASFAIFRDQNSFHCWGCNKGGTVIDFIMHYHKKTLSEAIKYLTTRV